MWQKSEIIFVEWIAINMQRITTKAIGQFQNSWMVFLLLIQSKTSNHLVAYQGHDKTKKYSTLYFEKKKRKNVHVISVQIFFKNIS